MVLWAGLLFTPVPAVGAGAVWVLGPALASAFPFCFLVSEMASASVAALGFVAGVVSSLGAAPGVMAGLSVVLEDVAGVAVLLFDPRVVLFEVDNKVEDEAETVVGLGGASKCSSVGRKESLTQLSCVSISVTANPFSSPIPYLSATMYIIACKALCSGTDK